MDPLSKDFVAASAVPLLLAILARSESYGYEIIRQIKESSGGRLSWSEGMLYPVLNKLEQKGIITAVWRKGDNGRERKYYLLTPEGQQLLAAERQNWALVSQILQELWHPKPSLL